MTTKFSQKGIVGKLSFALLMACTVLLFSCKSHEKSKSEGNEKHSEQEHNEKGEHNESSESGEHNEETTTIRGEHSRDEGGEGEGEEDGTQLTLDATYDVTKHGVHLVLKYNKEINSFVGFMENGTDKSIEKARVEVHLSNGTELGPTTPITLAPKMKKEIVIKATEASFDGWSTHAEIGNSEHAGEGGESHEGKEKGEHDGKKGEHQ